MMGRLRERRTEVYNCSDCGWSGLQKECANGEFFRDVKEIHCPHCDAKVGVVSYATYDDVREDWGEADALQKLQVLVHDEFQRRFAQESLKSPDQLPDVPGDRLVFTWASAGGGRLDDTVILHGDAVIWREPACYEGFTRFEEVATILKQKYGRRLVDLVPTPESLEYLCGDSARGDKEVARVRRSLSQSQDANKVE